MSTEIYSNNKSGSEHDGIDTPYLMFRRFGRGKGHPDIFGYQITLADRSIELSAWEMLELMNTLNDFFNANGLP